MKSQQINQRIFERSTSWENVEIKEPTPEEIEKAKIKWQELGDWVNKQEWEK